MSSEPLIRVTFSTGARHVPVWAAVVRPALPVDSVLRDVHEACDCATSDTAVKAIRLHLGGATRLNDMFGAELVHATGRQNPSILSTTLLSDS